MSNKLIKIPRYDIASSIGMLSIFFLMLLGIMFQLFVYIKEGFPIFTNLDFSFFKEAPIFYFLFFSILLISFLVSILLFISYFKGFFFEKYIISSKGIAFKNYFISWEEVQYKLIIESHFKGQDRRPLFYNISSKTKGTHLFVSKVPFNKVKRVKWYEFTLDFAKPTADYFFIPYSKKALKYIRKF